MDQLWPTSGTRDRVVSESGISDVRRSFGHERVIAMSTTRDEGKGRVTGLISIPGVRRDDDDDTRSLLHHLYRHRLAFPREGQEDVSGLTTDSPALQSSRPRETRVTAEYPPIRRKRQEKRSPRHPVMQSDDDARLTAVSGLESLRHSLIKRTNVTSIAPNVRDVNDPVVIFIDCSCIRSHRLKVQPQQLPLLQQRHNNYHSDSKKSRFYLHIHTATCNHSQSTSSDSISGESHEDDNTNGPDVRRACIIDLSLVPGTRQLLVHPLDHNIRLRDGSRAADPLFASSSNEHEFAISPTTDFLRIESSGRESRIIAELILTPDSDLESWIAFYVLAFASGLSVLCILFAFLFLNASHRKSSRTTLTTQGSVSENCPSSVSDDEVREEDEATADPRTTGRRRRSTVATEAYEMDDYRPVAGTSGNRSTGRTADCRISISTQMTSVQQSDLDSSTHCVSPAKITQDSVFS